jgi:hypothetical protein
LSGARGLIHRYVPNPSVPAFTGQSLALAVTIRAGKPTANVTRGDIAEIIAPAINAHEPTTVGADLTSWRYDLPVRINEGTLGELSVGFGFYFSTGLRLNARTVVVVNAVPLTTK